MSISAFVGWLFGRRQKMKIQMRGHRIMLKRIADTEFQHRTWFRDRTLTAEVVGVGELVGTPEWRSDGTSYPTAGHAVGDIVIVQDAVSGGL